MDYPSVSCPLSIGPLVNNVAVIKFRDEHFCPACVHGRGRKFEKGGCMPLPSQPLSLVLFCLYKAEYTATPVACRWAGVEFKVTKAF